MSKTPLEHQQEILEKLAGLTDYVNRLSVVLDNADLNKPDEDLAKIENHILMIQGQKEFVRMAITDMRGKYGNGR